MDESAHYEFLYRKAGVQVRYCTKPLSNDGTAMTTVFGAIKRAMAADYSRDLSGRVFRGQNVAVQLGFRQGAAPCYELRRMLL